MRPLLFLVIAGAVASCSPEPSTPETADPAASAAGTPAPTPASATPSLQASGPAATVSAESEDSLQWAASVVKLEELRRQGDNTVKLFGVAGGDPAMNGLYSYLAFYESPAEGWRVFRLGDFLEYRVLAEAPGRVDLEIRESTMDEATGNIGDTTRRVIVAWAPGGDGAPPASVTITPA